jgi:hypothetical protein
MAVSGHKTSKEVQRYIKMINELLAQQAIAAVVRGHLVLERSRNCHRVIEAANK